MDTNNLPTADKRRKYALSKYSSFKGFIENINPTVCIQRFGKFQFAEQCIESKAITFEEIAQWYGSDCPVDYIRTHLTMLNTFVNVSQHLQSHQITEIAYWIVDNWPYLNIAELTLVITRIKMGKYGKLYNNLSGEFILDCFSEYVKERKLFERKKETDTEKAYSNVQSLGAAIMKGIDQMPNVKKLLDEVKAEKGKRAAEEEEKKQKIIKLKDL